MTGNIDIGGKCSITKAREPTQGGDVATKDYVDIETSTNKIATANLRKYVDGRPEVGFFRLNMDNLTGFTGTHKISVPLTPLPHKREGITKVHSRS